MFSSISSYMTVVNHLPLIVTKNKHLVELKRKGDVRCPLMVMSGVGNLCRKMSVLDGRSFGELSFLNVITIRSEMLTFILIHCSVSVVNMFVK